MSKINEYFRLRIVMPLAEKVKGTNSSQWLRRIEEMESWTPEQIVAWQEEKLRAMIDHVYNHTVYYRRIMDERGLKPSDIQHIEDIEKLPVITKPMINEHFNEIVPDNIKQFKYREGRTGGTTGIPMFHYTDEDTWGYETATKVHHWRKAGYRFGDPFVAMGSSSLFGKKPSLVRRIYDKIRNEMPLNTVNLTDELCAEYVEFIKKHKVRYIYGYAGSIYVFTKYVSEHGIDMKQIQGVFTTSENLTDGYRKLIEKTYDCVVRDCYGARDAGMTAYESDYHKYEVGYNIIAEIINPIEENTGSVLTTNLLNYAFPLLRYQFGDDVELAPRNESMGYNGQVIRRVLGRTSDVMRLENGHNMTSTGFAMIMQQFDVKAFSFNKTGVNEVTLAIVPIEGKYDEKQEKEIRRTIGKYIGDDAKLVISKVDHFDPLANGKRRYFMNEAERFENEDNRI